MLENALRIIIHHGGILDAWKRNC